MQNFTIQHYRSQDIAQLADFFKHYLTAYPDAKVNHPEFYTYHPALQDGDNVFCVFDAAQCMVGFAPLLPVVTTDEHGVTGPHTMWTIMLVRPTVTAADTVRDLLLNGIVERANQLKLTAGLARTRLAVDLMISQKAELDYLRQKGFTPFEHLLVMQRDLAQAIPTVHASLTVTVRPSTLATAEEQLAYLQLFNTCFPENRKTLAELHFLLQSPLWQKGRAITAYSPTHEFIGSILVYWDEQQVYGITDDVMVLPPWRGQQIAKHLIREGLRYCQEQGLAEVRLEVKASNAPALAVYTSMGYHVLNEAWLFGQFI